MLEPVSSVQRRHGLRSNRMCTCVHIPCPPADHRLLAATRTWSHGFPAARADKLARHPADAGGPVVPVVPVVHAAQVNATQSCTNASEYCKMPVPVRCLGGHQRG